jgi:hypothetical protein
MLNWHLVDANAVVQEVMRRIHVRPGVGSKRKLADIGSLAFADQ